MAPLKLKKAKGKARARRTPSPTPPLTPPPAGRRGRRAGASTYTYYELRLLLKIIRKCQPRASSDWSEIERQYNDAVPRDRHRRAENLRIRFYKLVRMPKPTGDPETNELHEEAVVIDEELEGLEYTHILDDSPPPLSNTGTINLSSSDSDMEIVDAPAPPPARLPGKKTPAKRKADPSPVVRAVAQRVDSNSHPTQHSLLDATSAQLASILSPTNEDRLADHQREDIAMIALTDTIRDLRAELSQEHERRLALERQLRDEEMRRLVEAQVQQQLRQHFATHQTSQPLLTNTLPWLQAPSNSPDQQSHTTRTSGKAPPSWMPGPPPDRTDASGSGSR
ncbi:hypothetical protein RhiJN_02344 [Ceratobasidium sp. AG-Ba]|nr:hypothetical protein RhiJN_02344 [Ceratobasidium sp. AG-Ba]QRW03274.1 hypothetical protein RhiLY_02273 [Ceratobasidium sp. AG-Ba]